MTKMTAGCVETSLMTVLLVLVSVAIGFLVGSYYTKQQHVKENFRDLTGDETALIISVVIGAWFVFIAFGGYLFKS